MKAPIERGSTWVTRLTSSAPAAIAVLEVAGPEAVAAVMQCWKPAVSKPLEINAVRFGRWEQSTGEDIVVCLTDDETIELHCHGGKFAAEKIINDLESLGVKPRSTDDRAQREQVDVWSMKARRDLLRTTTPLTTALMLDQTRGAFSKALDLIEQFRKAENYEHAVGLMDELLQRYDIGKHLIEPWKIAVVGPPNVGKSSLLNAVLGFERAIVAPTAGTTRDVLNETTALMGWPIEIVDTAGIRISNDVVEAEGVRRALAAVAVADLALALIDPAVGWTERHAQLRDEYEDKLLWIVTKKDLELPTPSLPDGVTALTISAVSGEAMPALYDRIVERLVRNETLLTRSRSATASEAEPRKRLGDGSVALELQTLDGTEGVKNSRLYPAACAARLEGEDRIEAEGRVKEEARLEAEVGLAIPYLPEQVALLESLKAEMLDRLA